MTVGEKLKDARKKTNLSQEELSQKLCVSRQAVTKWETNVGIPDISNLKAIAQLLNVSIDYLLDDGTALQSIIVKEPINLSDYPEVKGNRLKEDAVILQKYTNATIIYQVSRRRKMGKKEAVLDFIFPGIYDTLEQWRDPSPYYLVEHDNEQYLVNVTKDFIISKKLIQKVIGKSLELGDEQFTKTLHHLK